MLSPVNASDPTTSIVSVGSGSAERSRDCQSFYDAKNFGAHIDAREFTRETLGMMAVLRIFEHLADGALKLMWGGVIRSKVNARARQWMRAFASALS